MNRRVKPNNDAGISDIVGTITLLAITVTLVGVAVAGFYSAGQHTQTPAPQLDVKASATPGAGTVRIIHAGGAALDRTSLTYTVTAGDTVLGNGSFPNAGLGAWDLGQAVDLPLSSLLATDGKQTIEINVISTSLGAIVASSTVHVGSASTTGTTTAAFSILSVTPASATRAQGDSLTITAWLHHDDGRKAITDVWVDLSPINGSAHASLSDDGASGDALAGDMNYTLDVTIPYGAVPSATAYTLGVNATDADGNYTGVSSSLVSLTVQPGTPGGGGGGSGGTLNCTGAGSCTVGPTSSSNCTGAGSCGVGGDFNCTTPASCDISCNVGPCTVNGPGDAPLFAEPSPFSPTSGLGNELVRLLGLHFAFVNSVRMTDTSGNDLGVVWWVVSDTEIDVILPIGTGDYTFTVTNPVGSDTTLETFHLGLPANAAGSAPLITGMTPTHGRPGLEVKLTGQNLSYLTDVRMKAGSNVFTASFFVVAPDGTESHFFVPAGAPPGSYTVTGSGAGGSSNAPVPFIVDIVPPGNPLTISNFTPASGRPFTQINITGTGFLDVVAANIGGANVALWVTDDTHMAVLTHPAVPLQRFNHITLYNTTGSVDTCCFEALPSVDSKEYAIYPAASFDRMAFNLTKTGNTVAGQLKFKLTNYSFTTGSGASLEMFTLTTVTMVVPNFKPGSTEEDAPVLIATAPVRLAPNPCRSAATNGVYDLSFSISPKKYSGSTDTMPFHFIFTWMGSKGNEFDLNVGSSLPTEDFTFGPQANTKIVKDGPNYDWPSSFTDCSSTP